MHSASEMIGIRYLLYLPINQILYYYRIRYLLYLRYLSYLYIMINLSFNVGLHSSLKLNGNIIDSTEYCFQN